jgi:hypothetical protein
MAQFSPGFWPFLIGQAIEANDSPRHSEQAETPSLDR